MCFITAPSSHSLTHTHTRIMHRKPIRDDDVVGGRKPILCWVGRDQNRRQMVRVCESIPPKLRQINNSCENKVAVNADTETETEMATRKKASRMRRATKFRLSKLFLLNFMTHILPWWRWGICDAIAVAAAAAVLAPVALNRMLRVCIRQTLDCKIYVVTSERVTYNIMPFLPSFLLRHSEPRMCLWCVSWAREAGECDSGKWMTRRRMRTRKRKKGKKNVFQFIADFILIYG